MFFWCKNSVQVLKMLRAVLNKSWRQHPTKQQLYSHLRPITKTLQVRRVRHTLHCWRSKNELISVILQWTPSRGRAKVGRPARTYIQQLCVDTGCSLEDLPRAMVVAYEFVLTSPDVSRMSCSSFLIVLEMEGRWPYSCCFVGYHDSFTVIQWYYLNF